jgi:hypothetical protein
VSQEDMSGCVNFKKGYTSEEYNAIIKANNTNLRKVCDSNNLKLNYMYSMLSGRMHMTYKYRVALDNALFENHEYDQYITKFEADGVVAYG